VFIEEFHLNINEINKLDNQKQFDLKSANVSLKNDSLRTSFKWHKLEKIQSYMYKDINCIKKLSQFIITTKNGWSPESSEIEDGTPVLGQEHILKNGKISLSASKFTTLTKSNIQDFYVKKDDFFVSRGNTVELVAMAGLVTNEVEENILYPDLYIKIEFNNLINKQYIAYLFNSFIGRLYFKHVAKGKNQTMVKVSSKELYNFYLPIPNKAIQKQLVTKIKTQIDKQKDIDKQIKQKQDEISKIIEDCIHA
jgi:type I restriction enzyme S subunit